MIVAHEYGPDRTREVDPGDISTMVDNPNLLWVDVGEPTEADLARLQQEFSLHPLAMEDVREHHQRPKLEKYPTHAFMVVYSSQLQEVNVFVGPTWVITVRETADGDAEPWSVDNAKARFDRTHPEDCDVGFLVYVLLDEIVDGYFDETDRAEDRIEELEDLIFTDTHRSETEVQQRLFQIRRRLVKYRRAIVPMREVVASLLRKEVDWIEDHDVVLLQDVYDHVLRVIDLLDSGRELMGNAVDAHLAIINNRMNSVMKKWTSWGAILLLSTLVAGIYGMNFKHMPELSWRFGYAYALGLMVTITVVGYWYFKKKDWL